MTTLSPMAAKVYGYLVVQLQDDIRGRFNPKRLASELQTNIEMLDDILQELEERRFINQIFLSNQEFILIELNM